MVFWTYVKMSNLQDNQISSTTKEHKISDYSEVNINFCIECQDTREKLGHSSIDCPQMICLNCLKHGLKIKGHHAGICMREKLYWPNSTQKKPSVARGQRLS